MTIHPARFALHRRLSNRLSWLRDELARRQALYRDLIAGKALARLPVEVRVTVASSYSVQEQFRDGDRQLEAALANALATWEQAPSSDTIPAMRPDVGCYRRPRVPPQPSGAARSALPRAASHCHGLRPPPGLGLGTQGTRCDRMQEQAR